MNTNTMEQQAQPEAEKPGKTLTLLKGEQTGEEPPEASKKKSRYSLFIRAVAGFLAILMVAQLGLFNASSIRFVREKYAGTEYETAADYIAENDAYLAASRLMRMRAIVSAMGEPETYEDFSICASVAIADEDYEKAARYLSEAIYRFTGSNEELGALQIKLGCLYGMNEEWEKAKKELSGAVKRNGSDSSGWLMLAESALRTEDYSLALDAMQTYGTMEELSLVQLEAIAAMQLSLGRGQECVETCNRALAMDGCKEAQFLYNRAQGYLLMGDMESAHRDTQKLQQMDTDEVDTRVLEAVYLDSTGDYGGALAIYRQILMDEPENVSIYEQADQCAYLSDDYEAMVELSSAALKLGLDVETEALFYKWLGVAQLELGDYADAQDSLSRYLAVDETAGEVYYLRGLCRMAQSLFEEAAADFSTAMETQDLADDCLYNRGLCYIQMGNAVLASADFQAILIRNQNPEIVKLTLELLGMSAGS